MRRRGRAAAARGDEQVLFQSFREDVLDGVPSASVGFLRRIALPGRICAPLCDALSDGTGSRSRLDPLAERRRYRPHPLFLEVPQRVGRDREAELATRLARRAANWFHARGSAVAPPAVTASWS